MRDKLKKVAAGTPGRKKPRRPSAVRGKKTKKAGIQQLQKRLRQRVMGAPGKGKGMSPGMKKAITGAATGMGSAGLLALARKLKPTGRLNAADLDRVKKMMGKKSGGKMLSPEQLKKIMGTQPFRKSPAGMKPVLDSQGNPVKNLFQKDNRPRRRGLRKALAGVAPKMGRKKTR